MEPGDDPGVDFDALFRAQRPRLVRVFSYAKRSGLDPEDVVGEVGLRFQVHRVRMEAEEWDEDRVVGWLVTVGKNVVKDHNRRLTYEAEHAAMAHDTGEADATAHRAVVSVETERVMGALPKRYATAIRLAAAGRTNAEIADHFGISVSSAKILLFRARERSRALWNGSVTAIFAFSWRRIRDTRAAAASTPVMAGFAAVAAVAVLPFAPPTRPAPQTPEAESYAVTWTVADDRPERGPSPRAQRSSSSRSGPDAAVAGVVAVTVRPSPKPEEKCDPICVGTRKDAKHKKGHTLYLKPFGDAGPAVTQDRLEVCDRVNPNPLVG